MTEIAFRKQKATEPGVWWQPNALCPKPTRLSRTWLQAAGYSADEKAKLFSGTAKRVYRLA